MSHTAYPDATALQGYLQSLSLFDSDVFSAIVALMALSDKAAAASAAWEVDTGWRPFLKDGADVTRSFDPPGPRSRGFMRGGGRVLALSAGLLAITSVTAGIAYSGGAAVGGTALTLYDHYFPMDSEAPTEGRPWDRLEFTYPQWGGPQSIKVVGRWGYAATVPEDAYQAILQWGAYLGWQELCLNVSRGLEAQEDVDQRIRFATRGDSPVAKAAAGWEKLYRGTVRRRKRVSA